MGLLDWFSDLFTPDPQAPPPQSEKQLTYYYNGDQFIPILNEPSSSGVNTNEHRVQTLDAVFACGRAIAEPIATMDVQVTRGPKDNIEFTPKHPIHKLLGMKPNSFQTSRVYFERAIYHMVNWGEHFARIFRDNLGLPQQYINIHPRLISNYQFDERGQIWWYVTEPGEWIPGSDMIHVPILNDMVRGRSILQYYRDTFGHALALRTYSDGFFAGGGKPNNWVETVDSQITPEQNLEFSRSFRQQTARGGSMLLPFGRKLHNMSFPPDDAQFLETSQLDVEQIARIFNVPPPIIGQYRNTNYSDVDVITRNYAKQTLQPYTEKIELEYTLKSFTPGELDRGYNINFDMSKLLRADPKTRAEVARTMVQNGLRTINEVRGADGFGPVEGGDEPLIQQNMAHLNELDELNKGRNNGTNNENQAATVSDNGVAEEV